MAFDLTKTVTIVYADCPWQYVSVRTGGSMVSGSAQHYPTLSVQELSALPVRALMPSPSLLFLWATVPMGTDPYTVMKAWGYTYKTTLFWRKTGRKGIGYWFRNAVEMLLIGVKGTPPPPPFRTIRDNILDAPVEAHSRKPEVFRRVIEEVTMIYPNRRFVELFARETAPGWTAYGLDLGHDLRDLQAAPEEPEQLELPFAEVGPTDGLDLVPAFVAPAVGVSENSPRLE